MNNNTQKTDFWRLAATFGLMLGLASCLIQFIVYKLEGTYNSPFVVFIVSLAIIFGAIIWGTIVYRNSLGGYINYWQAFGFGLAVVVLSGIVSSVYSYIFSSIDPDYYYRQLEATKQFALDQGLTQEKVAEMFAGQKEAIDYSLQHPFQSLFAAILQNLIIGSIFCLITSAFLKRTKAIY